MFNANALLAVAPIFGLASYCLVHLIVARVVRDRGNYFPLVVGCGCGLIAVTMLNVVAACEKCGRLSDAIALAGINTVAYLAFAFGYFNFINLNIASLRIRMLQELAEAGGRLPRQRLAESYNTETIIGLRIDRLTRGGHLIERDGRYYSGKRRFLIVARIFGMLRWVILGQRTHHAPRDDASRSNVYYGEEADHLPTHHAERDEYVEPIPHLTP